MVEEKTAATPEGEAPPTRLQRLATWYGHVSDVLTPQRAGLLLGVLVIALVGAVGGWGAATEAVEDLPPGTVGVAADAAPFQLTVRRARYFDELSPTFPAMDGRRYLAVSVDVTNTSDEPVSSGILAQAVGIDAAGLATIELRSGPTVEGPSVVRTVDSLSQRSLQPTLPTNVVLVWRQDVAEPVPENLTVTLSRHTWRRSSLDGSMGWRDPESTARIVVPLEALPEQP
ncbi:MAG: hypothetical protein QM713_09845 [Arachnia sp.]